MQQVFPNFWAWRYLSIADRPIIYSWLSRHHSWGQSSSRIWLCLLDELVWSRLWNFYYGWPIRILLREISWGAAKWVWSDEVACYSWHPLQDDGKWTILNQKAPTGAIACAGNQVLRWAHPWHDQQILEQGSCVVGANLLVHRDMQMDLQLLFAESFGIRWAQDQGLLHFKASRLFEQPSSKHSTNR